jgi:serine/threonine protein kinase
VGRAQQLNRRRRAGGALLTKLPSFVDVAAPRLSMSSPRLTSSPRQTGSPRKGPSIEDFTLIKPISAGGFGRVFLGRKNNTGDIYAIKVMKKSSLVRKNLVKQAIAERNIMAATNNPFVVKLFYAFESETELYFVMEYVIGGDCASLLSALGQFDEPMTRRYIAETVLALRYLHSLGVIHRDLKPDNMLLNSGGHVVLTDFGLSEVGVDARQQVLPAPAQSTARTANLRPAPCAVGGSQPIRGLSVSDTLPRGDVGDTLTSALKSVRRTGVDPMRASPLRGLADRTRATNGRLSFSDGASIECPWLRRRRRA